MNALTRLRLTVIVGTCVLLPAQAHAVGFVPITPLFGWPILAAAGVAGVVEGLWLASGVSSRRLLTASAVAVSKAVTAFVLMTTYLLLWGSVFYGANPVLSRDDRWAVFWFDPPLVLISLLIFTTVETKMFSFVARVDSRRTLWRVLGANIVTQVWIALVFGLSAFLVGAS